MCVCVCVCVLVKLWAVDDVIALHNLGATRSIPGLHSTCLVVAEKARILCLSRVRFLRESFQMEETRLMCLSVDPG